MKAYYQKPLFKQLTLLSCVVALTLVVTISRAGILDFFRDWAGDEISFILNKVLSARDKAGSIKNKTSGVKDVVNTARDNFDSLSGNVLDAVQDARENASGLLFDELAQSRDFIGDNNCAAPSPCDDFRNNLISLLDDMATITNALIQMDEASAPFALQMDFSRAKLLIQNAPGISLYPIYRAMNIGGDLFGSGILAVTTRVKDDLEVARAALASSNPLTTSSLITSGSTIQDLSMTANDSCDYIASVPNVVRASSFSMLSAAVTLKMVGKTLLALGETLVLGGPKEVGIHGYFKINFHDNRKKKFGTYIDAVADLLGKISAAIDNKLIYCAVEGERINVLQAMEENIFPANARPLHP